MPAHGSETRSLGIQPFLSPPALFERYAPLRDWLAEQIGEPVQLQSARTRSAFLRRIAAERYDFVFTSPHVVPLLTEETGYRPVAATVDRLAIVLVVRSEAQFTQIEDLADTTIAAPFEESLAAAFLKYTLSYLEWPYGSSAPTVRHHHHHSGALTTFARGEADALVVVTDGDLIARLPHDTTVQRLMSLGDGTLVRIIANSPSFPGMTLLASNDVLLGSPELEERLIGLRKTPEGQEVLQKIRHRGFITVEESDYRPFRPDTFQRQLPSMRDAMTH
ncbi:phosphate/phosphite/phosphonate ABC transporter substrate-binding protein [Thioalkalivibrio sp. ALJ16]|uniref:phosphate/phosphite/phosphonate ABC transporter substrate-binding protein n=1 Tax=Thioalkalivibrio sp. ALJ16 TaxID=1158762 RepID=UPI0006871F62|nr:phosphate/phosphite/phosphonate ABC transporter substrate-binding protein [Thioalkalivibrio sp. ALJ16]